MRLDYKKWGLYLVLPFVLGLAVLTVTLFSLEDNEKYAFNRQYMESFPEAWQYNDNVGNEQEVYLPEKIAATGEIDEIVLTNVLPSSIPPETVVAFVVFYQEIEVYIGDELRTRQGDKDASVTAYSYINGEKYIIVPIQESDANQEITIIYRSDLYYQSSLRMLQEVEIGTHASYIKELVLSDILLQISLIFGLIASIFLFVVATFKVARKIDVKIPLYLSITLLLWSIYSILTSRLQPVYFDYTLHGSAFTTVSMYIFSFLLPLSTYLVFMVCDEKLITKQIRYMMTTQALIVVGMLIGALLQLLPLNALREITLIFTLVIYLCLLVKVVKKEKNVNRWYIYAMLILLTGYIIDFIKYDVMIVRVTINWEWFQFSLSEAHFTTVGLYIVSILVVVETMLQIAINYSSTLTSEKISKLQLEMFEKRYDDMEKNNNLAAGMRHDMVHHFRSIKALYARGEFSLANEYEQRILGVIQDTANIHYSSHHIINITLSWFHDEYKKNDILLESTTHVKKKSFKEDSLISAVISNILQNAMEAVWDLEENRIVKINIKQNGNYLVIQCDNPFNNEIKRSGDEFSSTKQGENRGHGMSNIKQIIHMCNGRLHVNHDDGIFEIKVAMVVH